MEIINTGLRDVKLVKPRRFGDERGWFAELFNAKGFASAGIHGKFVQDNQSHSLRGVIRGLHYQLEPPQGKLVRALSGHIWDVAVDLRRNSPDFGKWTAVDLRGEAVEFVWIPKGFAHGFVVLSETANVFYKTTDYYFPSSERCIRWDDPTLAIQWPLDGIGEPTISAKDAAGSWFNDAELPPANEANRQS